MRRLLALLALIGAANPVWAWSAYGHQSVAAIAMATVKPATRRAVDHLLARSALLETPACPARTIDQIALWADCVRDSKPYKDRYAYAFPWHYQGIDLCRPFDAEEACPDGNCVSKQIDRMTRLLKDKAEPERVRVEALAFLIHFVGDLHQPLHVADRENQGGNLLKANYGAVQRTNLHVIWDRLLAERAISTPPGGPAGLLGEVPPAERAAMAAGTVADWARQSWQATHDAYGALIGDPCGPIPSERPTLTNDRIEALIPIVRLQVERGGLRLARRLDEALG